MSTTEARVHDALHEAMDELRVADHDIARMEHDLFAALAGSGRRQGALRQRRRRWGLVAAVAVLAAVVAGALVVTGDERGSEKLPAKPPASNRPLVPAELVGTWRTVPDARRVWAFVSDGRVSVDPTAGDFLEADFKDRVVTRSGDLYTVHTEDGCDETVRIRFVASGSAALSGQRTTCDPTLGPETEETLLERISPQPFLGGDLARPRPSTEPGFLPQSTFIEGVWLHVESGTLLAMGRPWRGELLRYVLDDDGDGKSDPDQAGRLVMSEAGPPVFKPDATTGLSPCRLEFTSLVVLHNTMTTQTPPGACLTTGARQTWVRIA